MNSILLGGDTKSVWFFKPYTFATYRFGDIEVTTTNFFIAPTTRSNSYSFRLIQQ